MEALAKVDTGTVINQTNSIVPKHSDNKVCKNRIEMLFEDLLNDYSKKLMPYAMLLTYKNEADSWDLVQNTLLKLIKNKDKFLQHPNPMAYAKLALKNDFRDNYRKQQRNISIEGNNIPVTNDGFHQEKFNFQKMLDCLETFNETDKTILAMLGAGHSYTEIQEVVSDISMGNLRVKANRARIQLANCIGRKL